MLVLKYNLDGKTYWATVKSMAEVKDFYRRMARIYKNIHIWVEDLAGRILVNIKSIITRFKRIIQITKPISYHAGTSFVAA